MIRKIKFYIRILGFAGLLHAIKSKLMDGKALFYINRNDCKYPFALRILATDVSTYKQIFLKQAYDFLVATPPKVIVDAGANIGLAAIYFANRYPTAKIIAIEPEASNFKLLCENVAPYTNIIPVQAALWHKNENLNLIDPGLGNWGFVTEELDAPEKPSGNVSHTVMAVTVDKIIEDYDLDKIDILKIDIEGSEREVFSDTSSWIEKVDALITELHERMKPGCNRSFYNGTNGFDNEWRQGENVYLSRGTCLTKSQH